MLRPVQKKIKEFIGWSFKGMGSECSNSYKTNSCLSMQKTVTSGINFYPGQKLFILLLSKTHFLF